MTFQAYALLSEYMGNLSDMESIKYILYDDNCHLGKFAENEERAAKNKVSEKLGKRTGMYIDRFHFKNHIGKECVQKRDPYKIEDLNDAFIKLHKNRFLGPFRIPTQTFTFIISPINISLSL